MDDTQRRLKQQWRDEQRARARATFPLSDADLRSLFDAVDEALSEKECDHSLRFTTRWLTTAGHTVPPVVAWLGENGGFCDCEVVGNAMEAWEEARKGSD